MSIEAGGAERRRKSRSADSGARLLASYWMRFVADGVSHPELTRMQETLRHTEWAPAWSHRARAFEKRADALLELAHTASAAYCYRQAALFWHYGHFLGWETPVEWLHAQREKARTYSLAAPFLSPPAERIEIACRGAQLPAYLRLPVDAAEPTPCVVLLGGLESTKEEATTFEQLLLERGLATIAFDGPGQGEFFEQQPFVEDFEVYTRAVCDYLVTRSELDGRIAVVGRSLGGYYAVRSAAADDRIRACVMWGGPYDLSFWDHMPPRQQLGFRFITGISDDAAAERHLCTTITLAEVAPVLRVPLYIQHGSEDHAVPLAQAKTLARAASQSDVLLDICEGGGHCSHNFYDTIRPAIADWTRDRLYADEVRPRQAADDAHRPT